MVGVFIIHYIPDNKRIQVFVDPHGYMMSRLALRTTVRVRRVGTPAVNVSAFPVWDCNKDRNNNFDRIECRIGAPYIASAEGILKRGLLDPFRPERAFPSSHLHYQLSTSRRAHPQ